MIRFVKIECPSCGGKLKRKGINHYVCSYCNTEYMMDVDVMVPVSSAKKEVSITKTGKNNSKKNINKQSELELEQRQKRLVFWSCLAFIFIFVGMVVAALNSDNRKHNPPAVYKNITTEETKAKSGVKSEYFKEFVRLAFNKEPEEVNINDYREITYFAMHDNIYKVDYRRNDGELITVTIPKDSPIIYDDIACFPKIKVLKWDAYKEKNEVIKNLPELEEFYCKISPVLVLQYVNDPLKLKKLSCRYYEDGAGIGELDKCANLTDLSLEIIISSLSKNLDPDLSCISKLKNLNSFYLDEDNYQELSFLADLPELKKLNLHCDSLKNINFLSQMGGLEELTLVDCDILSVDNLKYTPNLKVLRLEDNYQVTSYKPVADLVELNELMLSYSYGQELPDSFTSLNKVTRLTLGGFHDVSCLADFPNLVYLHVNGGNLSKFSAVACMHNLQELRVSGGYNLGSVAVLKELQNLQKVNFSQTNTAADTENLFMIPNLRELNINDTEFTIDLNLVERNESLQVLYMENLKWSAYNTVEGDRKYNYDNWEKLPMGECIDFLENFPNLRVLSIRGDKVDSLEFAGSLSKLELLDITDNYISDISVLNSLPNLTRVDCGANPLSANIELDSRIKVDNTTEPYERWPFIHYDW